MAKVILVRHPVGTGKTRRVWDHLLDGARPSVAGWNRRLSRVAILGPNAHVARTWLRELLLYAHAKGMVDAAGADEWTIRSAGSRGLKRRLREVGLHVPVFRTYGRVGHGEQRKSRYLILDEWHRLPQRIRTTCKRFVLGRVQRRPWFLGGLPITQSVYLVSATPVNPVNEQEDADLARSGSVEMVDEEFRVLCRRAKTDALIVVQTIARKRSSVDVNEPFFKVAKALGVTDLRLKLRMKWKLPLPWVTKPTAELPSPYDEREVREIARHLRADAEGAWHSEYVSAVGLVRTRAGGDRIHRIAASKKVKRCFGIRYEVLHDPEPTTRMDARKWLWMEHTRLPRLVDLLVDFGVLERRGGDVVRGHGKALVFCTHRGVALGLARSLQHLLDEEAPAPGTLPFVASNADGPLAHRLKRSARTFTEKLVTDFSCTKSAPFILVATDILSESLDLHQSCRLLVHYELPWSPLRLFQRIGRLTRLKTWGDRVMYNRDVRVAHIVIPGSVEEERVNRLIRRARYLHEQGLWPPGYTEKRIYEGLIGSGPSLHYREEIDR